jgi:uncharacterized heparinase superfamily protein
MSEEKAILIAAAVLFAVNAAHDTATIAAGSSTHPVLQFLAAALGWWLAYRSIKLVVSQ